MIGTILIIVMIGATLGIIYMLYKARQLDKEHKRIREKFGELEDEHKTL